jgi:hypothetical protein
MKVVKVLAAFLLLAIACLVIVSNFSSTEHRYECVGTVSPAETSSPETVFIRWEEYRWWVGLWSESEGNIWLEVPNKTVAYYEMVERSQDQVTIRTNGKMVGLFSTLSNAIDIDVPIIGPFSGSCRELGK